MRLRLFAAYGLVLLGLFLNAGCIGPGIPTPYFVKDYEVGKQTEVTVGSALMVWETGMNNLFAATLGTSPIPSISSGLRKELIYGGIAQGVVHVTYREFSVENRMTGYARPAFSQELQYDLSKSDRITFRDIRIQVIGADPEKIIFSILQGPSEIEKAQAQEAKPATPATNAEF